MAKTVRFYETGGPEVLKIEDLPVGDPGPGEVRIRHAAVGCNFADTYFRTGMYPVPLPNGMGVEAAGTITGIGSGVTGFSEGDRVAYTGSPLGAYSTERVMPFGSLYKLPDAVPFDVAAASTMRGLSAAYWLLKCDPWLKAGDTILLHAAAGGVGLLAVQWAKLLGLRVIGTVSSEEKAEHAKALGCDEIIYYRRDDVAARVTCHIGAELSGVSLTEAARNADLYGAIKAELLKHKVLFLRGQGLARADHLAFARQFGELEDHPVVGSDPQYPGLVRIYKDEKSPPDFYENSWHADTTWREAPQLGAVLHCIACPPVGGDTMWANMAKAYADLPGHVKATIDGLKARHSIEASFGARMRAVLTASFMAGGPLGSVIGVALGGTIAAQYGWRSPFAAMAIFGVILTLGFALVARERRLAPAQTKTRVPLQSVIASPTLRLVYLASGLQLFISGAMTAWLPSWFGRVHHLSVSMAGQAAAGILLVQALGMIVCGHLSDRISLRDEAHRFRLAIMLGILSAALLCAGFLLPPGAPQLVLIAAGAFASAGTTGPVGSIVAQLTHPALLATAFATVTLANNIFGLAPGPWLAGQLADGFGIGDALAVCSLAPLLAAICFRQAARLTAAALAK